MLALPPGVPSTAYAYSPPSLPSRSKSPPSFLLLGTCKPVLWRLKTLRGPEGLSCSLPREQRNTSGKDQPSFGAALNTEQGLDSQLKGLVLQSEELVGEGGQA